MRVCVRVDSYSACIIIFSYLYFTPIFYIIDLPFCVGYAFNWICVNYTCERPMRYLVMLGIRIKSRNRVCIVISLNPARELGGQHFPRTDGGANAALRLGASSSGRARAVAATTSNVADRVIRH